MLIISDNAPYLDIVVPMRNLNVDLKSGLVVQAEQTEQAEQTGQTGQANPWGRNAGSGSPGCLGMLSGVGNAFCEFYPIFILG